MAAMNTGMPLPKYHQIYLVLREQLQEGRFDGGMPGELALMSQFGVARVTIRRALAFIEAGVIRAADFVDGECGLSGLPELFRRMTAGNRVVKTLVDVTR